MELNYTNGFIEVPRRGRLRIYCG